MRQSIDLTLVSEWSGGQVRQFEDCLAGEEPLEIRVDGKPLNVTMRTPGTTWSWRPASCSPRA